MNSKTNIFFYSPKELTTDAFLVWLIYFLDSKEEYKVYKQIFFNNLILKKEDCDRVVSSVELKRQENNVDVLLMFRFEDDGEEQTILFENKTWSSQHSKQLARYKTIYPNCYRYFYYKLAYVNSQEAKEIAQEQYEVIDADMMSSTIEKMVDLHPLIKMYYDYIAYTFVDTINSFHRKLFVEHHYNVLWGADAQKYLCDIIVKKMTEQNVPYLEIRKGNNRGGCPWTQIDIANKTEGYQERLFWRVDIRSGKFYIRLNQYAAEPSKEEIDYKMQRLKFLRNEANSIVGSLQGLHLGEVHNRGIKESEVLIFFLEDNDLETLIEALPKISRRMMDVFRELN